MSGSAGEVGIKATGLCVLPGGEQMSGRTSLGAQRKDLEAETYTML
jgi:hypothetical protein